MLLPILFLPLVATVPLPPLQGNYVIQFDDGILRNVELKSETTDEKLDLSGLGIRKVEKNALDKVSQLKSLNLANNTLVTLPEFIFSNLTELEYLSLAENKIISLEYLFVNLQKLRVLNVSCNPLLHLHRGHLFGLTKDVNILTEGNNLWSISTGAFTNSLLKDDEELKQLEKLKSEIDLELQNDEPEKEIDTERENIALKSIENISTRTETAQTEQLKLCWSDKIITSVEILEKGKPVPIDCVKHPFNGNSRVADLRGLGIKGFQEKWYKLQSLPIITLDLADNEIADISAELLNDLPKELSYVNLSGNRIRNIWSGVIENKYLKALNLRNNLIEKIEDGALQKMNLTSLILNGNQLDNLSFASSLPQSLTDLVLLGNRFTSIPNGAFANLPKVVYLNLANNKITKLEDKAFRGLNTLQVLVITRNNLNEIERDAFVGLKQLNTLYLHRNSLTSLQKGTFSELENLKVLNLAWNKISRVTKDTFADLPETLEFLHIDYNEINSLEKGSFASVPRFTLSLAGNRISTIPRGTFNLPTLRDLHLTNNTLTTIDGDSYEGLPQLKRLWLKSNQIKEITKGSCKNLGSLNILDISKNPFRKLQNGALYGLSLNRGNILYVYQNQLKELEGGVFDDV